MTLFAAVQATARALRRAGVASATVDARVLVAHALSRDDKRAPAWELEQRVLLRGDDPFPPSARDWLDAAMRRRCAFEPVAYITGSREFFGLPFTVAGDDGGEHGSGGARVLVPRPDSEVLVQAALDAMVSDDTPADTAKRRARRRPHRALDLGTGSGALLVAFLHAARAQARTAQRFEGVGVDICAGAVRIAATNARAVLGGGAGGDGGNANAAGAAATFVQQDFARFCAGARQRGRYDTVFFNPPYVPDGARAWLAPDVAAHEPRRALFGGRRDGLREYRRVAPLLPRVLARGDDGRGGSVGGGRAFVEVGAGQARAVARLLGRGAQDAGARAWRTSTVRDLAGIERCVILTLPPPVR